jgi:acyl-coenzyme A thioesterase PaaI-like protein
MPGLIRHPVMALDSAIASQVPGLRRNDNLKVFNCQVNNKPQGDHMDLTPEEIKQFIKKPFAFVERTGIQAIEIRPRYVKLSAPLKGNENHIGSMYAGALFTLAEVPCGALYLTTFDVSKYYPVVKEMYIRFRRPATTDITVELSISKERVQDIQREAGKNGKAEFTLKTELKDTAGTVVALSKGVYQLRSLAEIE